MKNNHENLLNATQVAQILSVSKQTVYKMVREGVLPAYRISNKRVLRFKYADIISFLDHNKVNAVK